MLRIRAPKQHYCPELDVLSDDRGAGSRAGSGFAEFKKIAGIKKLNAEHLRAIGFSAVPAYFRLGAAMVIDTLDGHDLALGNRQAALDRGSVLADLKRIALLDPVVSSDFISKFQGNAKIAADTAAQILQEIPRGEQDVEKLRLLKAIQVGRLESESRHAVDDFREDVDKSLRGKHLPMIIVTELMSIFLEALVATGNKVSPAQFVALKADTTRVVAGWCVTSWREDSHSLDPPIVTATH